MADRLTRCVVCSGLGYFRCDCWPGDCICGQDEEICWECDGDGWIDPDGFDDDYYPEDSAALSDKGDAS